MIRKEKSFQHFLDNKIVNLSESSRYNIEYSNRMFSEFCLKKYAQTFDNVIAAAKKDDDPDELILEVLQDWVNSVAGKLSYSTLVNYISGINRYLRYQKIRIDQKEIEWPQNIQEERYAISLGEIEKILRIASYERRAFYLALISTGARPVEITGLRKKDIKLINGKYKALIPAHLTKKKIARTVFFSREVSPYLTTLLRRRQNENDSVFSQSTNPATARETEGKMFRYYCNKLESEDDRFAARYESTGYHKINLYCFRGYFFTKVLRAVGDDTAHAMIGHGAYLQQYQRRTDEEKKELWDEIESEILVHEDKKKEAKTEMENKLRDKRIESMERKLDFILTKIESGELISQNLSRDLSQGTP